jgi:hypothetical protein
VFGLAVGQRTGVGRVDRPLVQRRDANPWVTPGAAMGLVDGDPVQPGEEARVALESGDAAPCPQERLLRDLLGLVPFRHEPQDDRVEPVGVTPHELLERAAIPVLGASDELGVLVDHATPRQAGRSLGCTSESFAAVTVGRGERRRGRHRARRDRARGTRAWVARWRRRAGSLAARAERPICCSAERTCRSARSVALHSSHSLAWRCSRS